MAEIEIRLPKMGESVTEATITNWLKNVGDTVAMDEALVEVATDKVDNELPSEAEGVLIKQMFNQD
ncbi:2-oxo acid dehydrogenase subunit E2, partial [Crocinitomicaceae bacterium]|nr:2-oxo acid dehydrogenase subunit E2 [Crocinitomicaceae bacterium]